MRSIHVIKLCGKAVLNRVPTMRDMTRCGGTKLWKKVETLNCSHCAWRGETRHGAERDDLHSRLVYIMSGLARRDIFCSQCKRHFTYGAKILGKLTYRGLHGFNLFPLPRHVHRPRHAACFPCRVTCTAPRHVAQCCPRVWLVNKDIPACCAKWRLHAVLTENMAPHRVMPRI